MNKTDHISEFLLERYRIGEVTLREKARVEKALAGDSVLTASLAGLDNDDRDFKERFPRHIFFKNNNEKEVVRLQRTLLPGLRRIPPSLIGICAAALVIAIVLPMFILRDSSVTDFGDRIKGNPGGSVELNVFLKGEGGSIQLRDQDSVKAGNTIQLAYRVPATASNWHGIIFSVDGRSVVTLHYPYNQWQTTNLVSGRSVPLDEAYKLDDAPHFEIFFFVTGDKPLNIGSILNTAKQLTPKITENPKDVFRNGTAAFKGYELETLTLWKE